SPAQALRAHALVRPADASAAFIEASAAQFVNTVVGEEIDDIVPQAAIQVVAVGRLQIADQALIVEGGDALLELFEANLGRRRLAERGRNGDAALVGAEVVGQDGQIAALIVVPAAFVRALILRM